MLLVLIHQVDLALEAFVLQPLAFQIQLDLFLPRRFANITLVQAASDKHARGRQRKRSFERNLRYLVPGNVAAYFVQQAGLEQVLIDGLESFGADVSPQRLDVTSGRIE